jgi:hypothetical protein
MVAAGCRIGAGAGAEAGTCGRTSVAAPSERGRGGPASLALLGPRSQQDAVLLLDLVGGDRPYLGFRPGDQFVQVRTLAVPVGRARRAGVREQGYRVRPDGRLYGGADVGPLLPGIPEAEEPDEDGRRVIGARQVGPGRVAVRPAGS